MIKLYKIKNFGVMHDLFNLLRETTILRLRIGLHIRDQTWLEIFDKFKILK